MIRPAGRSRSELRATVSMPSSGCLDAGVLAVLCVHEAIRDVLVTGYEPLIDSLDLLNPQRPACRAAAIKVGTQTIVIDSPRDFTADRPAPWDIKACSPDDFLHAMVDLSPKIVFALSPRSPTASRCHDGRRPGAHRA